MMARFAGRAFAGPALVLSLTACASSTRDARPSPTASSTSVTRPAATGPAAIEWISDIAASPNSGPLYVATHDCPGEVAAGRCTRSSHSISPEGGYNFAPAIPKASPLTLWRYDGSEWKKLGSPGVSSHSSMLALPGAVVLVLRSDPQRGGDVTGTLRVSADEGETWVDWKMPPGGTVVVAGEHVVAASRHGWFRRSLSDSDWEDVTPPARAPLHKDDTREYGVVGLDDGTLVATAYSFTPGRRGGFYLVSKDGGRTWGRRHANPGTASKIDRTDGAALYARCLRINRYPDGATTVGGCGTYRSADLEHWTQAAQHSGWPFECRRDPGETAPSWRETVKTARAGEVVYAITTVPYLRGREAVGKDLYSLDGRHRQGRVLERSHDSCRSWTTVEASR